MTISRTQALELIESLSQFQSVPRHGLDLASTICANAQRAQIEAQKRFSISLPMTPLGVKELALLLSALHQVMLPNRVARLLGAKISFAASELIANTFGAFLGETLRNHVGGEWQLVDFNRQTLVALCFDKNNWTLPTYKAGKQFMNGDGDNVEFYYSVMVQKRLGGGIQPIITVANGVIHDHRTGTKKPLQ